MEHLLVEKIAVDFWRLKRVLRFETGSIRKSLDAANYDYYNKKGEGLYRKDDPKDLLRNTKENMTNAELDEEIAFQTEAIKREIDAAEAGKKFLDSFKEAGGEGEGLGGKLLDGIMNILKESESHDEEKGWHFKEFEQKVEGYAGERKKVGLTDRHIAIGLLLSVKEKIGNRENLICKFEQKKLTNKYVDEVNVKVTSLPDDDSVEKLIKYERAIQKSILQNLAILTRLQSLR